MLILYGEKILSETTNTRKNPLSTILLLVVIIGATAFWYYALYAPIDFEVAEESGSFSLLSANTTATELVIDIDADIGDFSIDLLPEGSNDSVYAFWNYTYLIDTQQSTEPAVEISVTESTVGNVLTIMIIIDHDGAVDSFQMLNLEFSLAFASNFTQIDILGYFNVANVEIDLEDVTLGNVSLYTDVGSYALTLSNSEILGDLDLYADVGSIELDWEDNIFLTPGIIDFSTSVGSINVDWTQRISLNSSMELWLETDTGSIELDVLVTYDSAKLDILWSMSAGDVDNDYENGQSVGNDHYQTINYDALSIPTFFIEASSSIGSIDINIDTY